MMPRDILVMPFKNPFFYFGIFSIIIFVSLLISPLPKGQDNSFLAFYPNQEAKADLFLNQEIANPLEASQLLFSQETSLQGTSPVYLFHPQSLALLSGQEERKEIQEYIVKKGDTINGKQVVEIKEDHVVLKAGEQRYILKMKGITSLKYKESNLLELYKERD